MVIHDWNVLATTRERHFDQALQWLKQYGPAGPTDYYDVAVLRVADIDAFLDAARDAYENDPQFGALFGRISPTQQRFTFQSPGEFESLAVDTARGWLGRLHGKRFHVRMHRRGFKGRMDSQHEEQFLDRFLKESLEQIGALGEIGFTDPDAIITVETVGQGAGMAIWSREQLQRYPFLKVD